ncbi:MAG TPA: glycosyltransferase [Candidatus Acidoferrales bacterium]|nr:glycosyltransferase [Candidatus Acidoferrales bacterium]
MPKLLLVAYHFPPEPTAAAVRLGQVASNLPKFGWEVSVLSRPREDPVPAARVIRTHKAPQGWLSARQWYHALDGGLPFKWLVRLALNISSFPDQSIWWVPVAINAALRSGERYDAVMTSYFPSAGHFIGWHLSNKWRVPWIADYQDLWSGNGIARSKSLRSRLGRHVERLAARHAAAITCCKPSFAQALRRIHGAQAPYIKTIPFACDVDAWRSVPDTAPSEFGICYAGSFYSGHSSPDLLFDVISQMRAAGSAAGRAARFHYYGQSGDQVMASARRANVVDIVRLHGCVDRHAVMCGERRAAVLVSLFEVEGELRRLWLPSKLFEYAGARRWVLGIGPAASEVEEFIARNNLGFYASDRASCARAIEDCYALFSAGRYGPQTNADANLLTPTAVAQRFARLLDRVVGVQPEESRESASA